MRRVLASLAVIWFGVVTAEPAALHACAMHGGGGRHAVTTAPPTEGHHEHAGHGSGASESTTDSPAHDAQACTCIGDCCAALATAVPRTVLASFAPASVRLEVPTPRSVLVSRSIPGLLLPFATAPPVLPAPLS